MSAIIICSKAGADMTIKAVLRHGVIQPVEPLPPDWAEGLDEIELESKEAVRKEWGQP